MGRLPGPHDPLPAQPADRRVERREVEADGLGVGGGCRRPPFALGQHLRLVVLGDGALAALAVISRSFRLSLRPAQPVELQPLHRPAMGAGHEVAPLVGCVEFSLDPAQPPDRRRRDHEHFAPVREGGGPCLGQRDRIALLVGRGRVGIDLVEEDITRGHRPQAGGAVRTGQDQDAAGEFLRQHRIACIARPGGVDPFA